MRRCAGSVARAPGRRPSRRCERTICGGLRNHRAPPARGEPRRARGVPRLRLTRRAARFAVGYPGQEDTHMIVSRTLVPMLIGLALTTFASLPAAAQAVPTAPIRAFWPDPSFDPAV